MRPAAYDEGMDTKYIAERLAIIRNEIRELRELNARYWTRAKHGQVEESAYRNRQLRLCQIKEELALIRKKYA